jgi:hypothetical protein
MYLFQMELAQLSLGYRLEFVLLPYF